ncbi:M24 family metallopeptidase [Rhizosaccharibacter radicis]|uniref:Xaa-Pro peptidase family protein n=1 Tax=Rhizosaccharibacter radicis TaxID=2782605 RepID=A0ABT1W1J3_9PROT|nr:Xaa-Pro peptidase family protein [Acetobacteraceae bacterium KSS12]
MMSDRPGLLPPALERRLADLSPWPDRAPPIEAAEHATRIAALRLRMARHGLDALLVGAGPSLRYLCGLGWGATERLVAMLLVGDEAPRLVCPAFELGSLERALTLPVAPMPWEEDEDPAVLVASALPRGARLGLDPELPIRVGWALRRAAPGLVLADGAAPIEEGRRRKSPAELALMRQAMRITEAVQRLAAAALEPGIAAGTVRRFIDGAHRALGATDGSSFCAVQFGRATAFPHGIPGEQHLQARDLVLVDTGCVLHGYHSDITRTFCFGAPDAAEERVWWIEREAQAAAFAAVRPGVPAEAVDAAARGVLERHGLGPGYGLPGLPHRTGHGIGLSIHEPTYIVRGERTLLEPGMCFSIEPMIVVPDRFGVRLEDHVVVTDTGAEWFTAPLDSIAGPSG